jgi:ABC-2 type transport system ATP-binding protein
MAEAPVIAAQGLGRDFGSFTAVRDIDLRVERGEVFGLLGANGAGKTTAIRMLCGTLAPSRGRVEVAGVDMLRHPRRARSRIGYVTQRFTLYGELSVTENLKL